MGSLSSGSLVRVPSEIKLRRGNNGWDNHSLINTNMINFIIR